MPNIKNIGSLSPHDFINKYFQATGIRIKYERIEPMIDLCKKYYNDVTFKHAVRVANHTLNQPITEEVCSLWKSTVYTIALAHDLLEDTDCSIDEIISSYGDLLPNYDIDKVKSTLELLTKSPYETYEQYCTCIRESDNMHAYVIKLADIKDHLTLTDTLTERLKEKYLKGLAILL